MASTWNIFAKLSEISLRVANFARIVVPIFGIFTLLEWLFKTALRAVKTWWVDLINAITTKIADVMATLSIDLSPDSTVAALLSKVNVVFPLSEAWHLILIYLSVASVLVGIRWMRNLIPGLS